MPKRVSWSVSVSALLMALLLVFVSFAPAMAATAKSTGAMKIAPGDNVVINVFGQADLTGEYQVDGNGAINLPLIGNVSISNLTEAQAGQRLQSRFKAGYLNNPVITVRFKDLRPIYMTGDVRNPGTLPFRFGTTALMAISQSGGYQTGQIQPAGNYAADLLTSEQNIDELRATEAIQRAKIIRLQAQRAGKDTFERIDLPALPAGIWEVEEETLRAERTMLERALGLIRNQKPKLDQARISIKEQIAAEKRRLALVTTRLEKIKVINKQGLIRENTLFALEREKALSETNVAQYTTELARLEVASGEQEIQANTTIAAFNRRTLTELVEAQTKLKEIERALPKAQEFRALHGQQIGQGGARNADGTPAQYTIQITRNAGSEPEAITATEATLLQPGDIVIVTRLWKLRLISTGAARSLNGVGQ